MTEEWRPVVGHEGSYEVSSAGRVRSLPRTIEVASEGSGHRRNLRGRMLKPSWDGRYMILGLSCTGVHETARVHRLVALAFLGEPKPGQNVNHKNGQRDDNRVSNLEWTYPKQNTRHALDSGLMDGIIGENHYASILTEDAVRFIRHNYKPYSRRVGVRALGRRFGVKEATVWHVIKNRTWRHVV